MMNLYYELPVGILPISCILVLLLLKITFSFNKMELLSKILTPGVLLLTFGLLPHYSLESIPLTQSLFLDSFSFPIVVMTFLIMMLLEMAGLASTPMLFLILFSVLTFSLTGLLPFYVAFELNLIPIFLLILGKGYQPERLFANKMMLLYTLMGSLPLLLVIISGSSKGFLCLKLVSSASSFTPLIFFMVSLAFLVKLPIFCLHLWLPLAHVEAPLAGSMVLAGILLKLGGYGLLRFMPMALTPLSGTFPPLFLMTIVGAALAPVLCMTQSDLKVIIAYSSVGHMSLAAASIMTNTCSGTQAALILFVAHGFTSAMMFFLAGEFYKSSGTRHILLNKGGIATQPSLVLFWFLACLMNAAGPPSINLIAEILSTMAALHAWGKSAVFLSASLFLGMLFNLKLFNFTTQGHPKMGSTLAPPKIAVYLTLGGFSAVSAGLGLTLPYF